MGGGLFKVEDNWDSRTVDTLCSPGHFGHPASGARRIGNSVSLDFAGEAAQKINVQGNIGTG